jgi:Anaphase-promoting complex, cyclosome, subunit 3
MKPNLTILFATTILLAAPMVLRAQPLPPIPPLPTEDDGSYSPSNFKRALSDLKTEREALDAEWRAITRRLAMPQSSDPPELDRLHLKIKEVIARLQRERMELKATPTAAPNLHPKPETPTPEPKKAPDLEPPPAKPTVLSSSNVPVDVVQLAQTLFRAERYEEALGVFRSVDLKGKKPEERAPIAYLTADCLHRLGKTDEAIAMLREVASSKGDEHMADYAQWQIENMRWHRDVQNRLTEIRRRLGTGEKR